MLYSRFSLIIYEFLMHFGCQTDGLSLFVFLNQHCAQFSLEEGQVYSGVIFKIMHIEHRSIC